MNSKNSVVIVASFISAILLLAFVWGSANAGTLQTKTVNETPMVMPDPSDLDIVIRGASTFYMDSNNWCVAGGDGPEAVWLPVVVTNNHPTDSIMGLQATVTPPTNVTADDTVRFLGNLAPGESAEFFYFFDARALRVDGDCTTQNNQDHWYSEAYSIVIDTIDGNGTLTGPATFNDTMDTARMISAQAGGVRLSDGIGDGATVGQIITQSVLYDFGNNNGANDLFLQPTGNGNFPDECLRLVGSEILASDVPAVPIGTEDQLFFTNLGTSAGDQIRVEYQWQILCVVPETFTYPWAEMTSGTQFKYAGSGYEPTTFPIPAPVTGTLGINKDVEVPGNWTFGDDLVVTYTIDFINQYTLPVKLDTIHDTFILPPIGVAADMIYGGTTGASDITDANSSLVPTPGTSGPNLDWYGIPADVSYIVPASSTISLVYTATIIYDQPALTPPQMFTNVVTATVGNTVIGPAGSRVTVDSGGPTAVNLTQLTLGAVSLPILLFVVLTVTLVLLTVVAVRRRSSSQFI